MIAKHFPFIASLWALALLPSLGFAAGATPPAAAAKPAAASTPDQAAAPVASAGEQELSVAELAALQKNLKNHDYLGVQFTQRVYKDLRKKTSLSYGKAFFHKPNSFRWILDKPTQDEWIYDGKDLWHYQPERKEAMHYPAGATKGRDLRQIVDMVINFNSLLSEYKVEKAVRRGDEISLNLVPLKASDIQKADLTLETSQNYIRELRLHFRGQNHTTFTFTNPSTQVLAAETFKAPAGVKIKKAM